VLQTPVRVVQTLRPRIPAGVFAATAVSTVVFSATPFLVPAIATDRDVTVGLVGIISTAQLAGFVIATSLAPRRFRPRRRMMVAALVLGVVANLLSAVSPWFAMLVAMRFVSGTSLGLIAWIAWAEVFGDDERVGDVAVIGPIIGTIASPIIAVVLDATSPDWIFVGLAALYLAPAVFVREMSLEAAKRPHRTRHRPTRAASAILVALCLLTLGGSAAFVFVGAIGLEQVGLSPFVVSLVFSANALAGLPSARYRGERKLPGFWMSLTGVAAIVVGTWHVPAAFLVAMIMWGFSFWMGIPGAFSLLAERSAYPDERAGDAQAVMAFGRVIGPLVGGALYEISAAALGIGAGSVMVAAAGLLVYVEWRVRPQNLAGFVRA
jgi:DHA1 family inner membrane transport protein